MEEEKQKIDEVKEADEIGVPKRFDNVNYHLHNGLDSPKINENDIGNAINKATVVLLTTNQTIAGVKTFSSIPVLPASDPTADNEAARKAYVDGALGTIEVIASDNIRDSANSETTISSATYTKHKEIQYNEINGTIRVYFETWAVDAYARIYVNGIAVGTERLSTTGVWDEWTEDFEVETGDLIQVYIKRADPTGTGIRYFRLKYDKQFAITAGTVNLN